VIGADMEVPLFFLFGPVISALGAAHASPGVDFITIVCVCRLALPCRLR
jgi:hypothetical protein